VKKSFLLLFVLFSLFSKAQVFDTIAFSLKQKPKIVLKFDNRNSFISSQNARISGIKIGLKYNGVFQVGAGYNYLDTEIKKYFYPNDVLVKYLLKLNYLSFFAEYNYYRKGRWEFSLPIQVGVGTSFYKTDETNFEEKLHKTPVMVYETNLTGHYLIIKYLALGFGAGYRLVATSSSELKQKFNSPVYHLYVKINFSDIYNDIVKTSSK